MKTNILMQNFGNQLKQSSWFPKTMFPGYLSIFLFLFTTLFFNASMVGDDRVSNNANTPSDKEVKNPVADVLITGKVIETMNNRPREYSFSVFLGTNGYRILLRNEKDIIISSAYSDYKDTLTYNAPGPVVFGNADLPDKSNYTLKVAFLPTPYPLCADTVLQAVWITTCAKKAVVDTLLTQYPPGISFYWLMQNNSLDWKEFSIDRLVYSESPDQSLLSFIARYPQHISVSKNSLLQAGIKKGDIDKLEKTPNKDGTLAVPVSPKKSESPEYCSFTTIERFSDKPFSKEAQIKWSRLPVNGIQAPLGETKISVEKVEVGIREELKFPSIPYSSVMVTDYRVKGIAQEPLSYALTDKVWPLRGTARFEELNPMANRSNTVNPTQNPPPQYLILVVLLLAILPFVFFFIKNKVTKE